MSAHEHSYLLCENKCLVESKPVATASVTLTVAGWSNKTQRVSVAGVTTTNYKRIFPDKSSMTEYYNCGIRCVAEENGFLTFNCLRNPINNLIVGVLLVGGKI